LHGKKSPVSVLGSNHFPNLGFLKIFWIHEDALFFYQCAYSLSMRAGIVKCTKMGIYIYIAKIMMVEIAWLNKAMQVQPRSDLFGFPICHLTRNYFLCMMF